MCFKATEEDTQRSLHYILLLDEPMNALDKEGVRLVKKYSERTCCTRQNADFHQLQQRRLL